MNPRPKRTVYRIIDNPVGDEHAPYALLNPDSEVIRVHTRVSYLADLAFDQYGADEVRHDENLIRAGGR